MWQTSLYPQLEAFDLTSNTFAIPPCTAILGQRSVVGIRMGAPNRAIRLYSHYLQADQERDMEYLDLLLSGICAFIPILCRSGTAINTALFQRTPLKCTFQIRCWHVWWLSATSGNPNGASRYTILSAYGWETSFASSGTHFIIPSTSETIVKEVNGINVEWQRHFTTDAARFGGHMTTGSTWQEWKESIG